jgi:hypothetical protein
MMERFSGLLSPTPAGRHRHRNNNRPNIRSAWAKGVIFAGVAAAVALALVVTNVSSTAGSHSATEASSSKAHTLATPRMTQTQARELDRLLSTSRGRAEVQRALRDSFGSTGAKVTVGSQSGQPVKSATTLTAYDWQTGVTGNHIWIIASYGDIYGWSIAGLAARCAIAFPDAAPVCAFVGAVLATLDIGHGNSPSHGVWIAGYFISYGAFVVSAFYKWTWGRY